MTPDHALERAGRLINRVEGCSYGISLLPDGSCYVNIHQVPTYQAGVDIMRKLGIRTWKKNHLETHIGLIYATWHELQLTLFCGTLPPTCRVETRKKLIPKTETKELGEMIEIEEQVVICGEESEDHSEG